MGDRKLAEQFYNQAVTAVNDKGNPSHLQIAYQLFSSAVLTDPTWGAAHYQRGNNNSDLLCYPAAIADWRRALECDQTSDDRAKILVNIGWRLHSLGRSDEAFEATKCALEINPDLALGHLNMSLIHGMLGNSEKSVKSARRAYELDPNDVHTPIALAFSLLFAGKFQEGFKFFESRFRWRLHHFLHYPYPKWEGEKDKTVFLVADQGLGDTLSFSRFLPAAAAKCKFMHVIVQPELMRAFTHAFAAIENINLIPMPSPFLQADAWSTFVSLPYTLGLTDAEVRACPAAPMPRFGMDENWKVPDRKLHIGVAWAGSPLNDIDKDRNIPITNLLELYRVPGVQLYGLQVGDRVKDLHDSGCSALIRDLSPYIRDICDTISILGHLDMVITVESALGHICGAVDKECWIPYSYLGRDYRAGHTGKTPLWYKNHRFFRQGPDMQWSPVFDDIVTALKARAT